FVAFDHLIARHDDIFFRADVLLLQTRTARLVQQIERHRATRLGGRVELHRNRDEPEGDRQGCYRPSCHGCLPTVTRTSRTEFPGFVPHAGIARRQRSTKSSIWSVHAPNLACFSGYYAKYLQSGSTFLSHL